MSSKIEKFETRCDVKFNIVKAISPNELDSQMIGLANKIGECLIAHTNMTEKSARRLATAWICNTEILSDDVKIKLKRL